MGETYIDTRIGVKEMSGTPPPGFLQIRNSAMGCIWILCSGYMGLTPKMGENTSSFGPLLKITCRRDIGESDIVSRAKNNRVSFFP